MPAKMYMIYKFVVPVFRLQALWSLAASPSAFETGISNQIGKPRPPLTSRLPHPFPHFLLHNLWYVPPPPPPTTVR